MGKKRLLKMVLLGIRQYQDPYYQGIAAQLAFFFILSIMPTLIVLSQLLGLVDISLDFIKEWIERYVVSEEMASMVSTLLDYRSVTGTNIFLIVSAVWAASRIQFSLTRVADYTYSGGADTGRFWRDRIRAMGTMLITILIIAFVIVVMVYGSVVLRHVVGFFVEGPIVNALLTVFRWPATFLLYLLMLTLIYYFLPRQRQRVRDVIPGSGFTAIGMMVVTMVYSLYTSHAVTYDVIYGSLASMVALLIWLYFISWVLCLGILINKVWMDTRNDEQKAAKKRINIQ